MTSQNGFLETVALSIVALLVLSINGTVLERGNEMISNETALGAISVAQELLEEIHTKAYNRAGIDIDGNPFRVEDENDLIPQNELGEYAKSNNLSRYEFKTVDDYNGYVEENVAHGRINDYSVWVEVHYVKVDDLLEKSDEQTHAKLVRVYITSNSLGLTDSKTGKAKPIYLQTVVSNHLARF